MMHKPTTKAAILENGVPRWHSRGYIPHFDCPNAIQHVTFHLADSLPQAVLQRLDAELDLLPSEKRNIERRKRLDTWMDAGYGSCLLRQSAIGSMVQNSLFCFDSKRYRLLAWVVMPNHTHVLLEPIDGWTVAKIVASWKRFTAGEICHNLRLTGDKPADPIWHREYWDRYIRNEDHLAQVIEYIHRNPVKAGLAPTPEAWPWSSAARERQFPNWRPTPVI